MLTSNSNYLTLMNIYTYLIKENFNVTCKLSQTGNCELAMNNGYKFNVIK